jgi:hypothetical protein
MPALVLSLSRIGYGDPASKDVKALINRSGKWLAITAVLVCRKV